MSISTPFIRRPVATSLLMAAFVLVGIAAYPLLPVAPLPRVDFPTISVNAKFPGASPETMASTVAQPLEYQFAQIAGVAQLTSVNVLGQSSITIQFDLDRNIDAAAGDVQAAINAATGQLPKNLPVAADLSEGQSVRLADHDPVGAVRRGAADRGRRLRRQHPVAADLADRRRVAGVHRRRAEARGARAGRSRQARRDGPHAGGRARHAGQRHRERAEGHGRRRAPLVRALCQRPAHQGGRIQRRHPALPQRRAGAGAATSARRWTGRRTALLAGWQNGKRGIILVVFKQPGANVIETVDRIKAALPALRGGDPAGDPCQRGHGPHADHPRLGARRAVHADAVDQPGRDGDLPVPAQRLGHDHPVDHRAGGADLHLRGDVPAGLQPRQPVADGADHRGRLRGRRRHRHAGEHLPPHRGGHAADGGGAEGRRRDRLHHRLDQPVADRGVHPAAADGRHRRPAVPRVRHDRHHRGGGLRHRVADADADDVLALPAPRHRPATAGSTGSSSGFFDAHDRRLSPHARHRAAPPVHHAAGVPRHRRADRRVCTSYIPKGFFPPQDTGVVLGISEGAQDVSFKEMSRIQQALERRRVAGPGRAGLRRHDRRRHRRADRPTTAACSSR